MLAIGGIFDSVPDAERVRSELLNRGVRPDEITMEAMNRPFWTQLVDLDIPSEESILYEPYLVGGETLLIIRTDRLPIEDVLRLLEQHKALIVQAGVAPPMVGWPMRPEKER